MLIDKIEFTANRVVRTSARFPVPTVLTNALKKGADNCDHPQNDHVVDYVPGIARTCGQQRGRNHRRDASAQNACNLNRHRNAAVPDLSGKLGSKVATRVRTGSETRRPRLEPWPTRLWMDRVSPTL